MCQFPFTHEGRTYFGCTSIITNKTKTGDFEFGKPWCSTKTDDNHNHITGNGYYGDCLEENNCPTEAKSRSLVSSPS